MLKSTFLKDVKEGAVPRIKGHRLYYMKKYVLLVKEDDSETRFKDLEDAYENAKIGEEKLKDIVERSNYEDMFITTLDDGGIRII